MCLIFTESTSSEYTQVWKFKVIHEKEKSYSPWKQIKIKHRGALDGTQKIFCGFLDQN